MIINNTYRFIFIHIPKCGGTALTNDLAPLTKAGDIELGGGRFGTLLQEAYKERGIPLEKHSSASRAINVLGSKRWRDFFTFALVRNPFTRAVSAYRFAQRWSGWADRDWIERSPTVNEFIAHPAWLQAEGAGGILRPQIEYTAQLDKAFWLENYDECLREIYALAGQEPPEKPLGSRNASPKPADPTTLELNDRSVDLILRKYHADFSTFGYDRTPPTRQAGERLIA